MSKDGNKYKYIIAIAFMIFGIAIAMQFKSTLMASKQNASAAMNIENLKQQILLAQEEEKKLKEAINENLVSKDEIIKSHLARQNDESLQEEWDRTQLLAGLTDVKGPGITVKLDDAPARDKQTEVSWQIIHDRDIWEIINLLKIGGAQAISINGERITPISEQICAGPTVRINGNRYPVPYIINAIGNPDDLYDSINDSEIVAFMREMKIRVEITKSQELKILKFSNTDNLGKFISGLEVVNK